MCTCLNKHNVEKCSCTLAIDLRVDECSDYFSFKHELSMDIQLYRNVSNERMYGSQNRFQVAVSDNINKNVHLKK